MNALQRTAFLAQSVVGRTTGKQNAIRYLSQAERAKRDAYRAKMQAPGDTPVYLRGGTGDKVLFGASVILVGLGTLHTVWRVYCMM